MTEDGDDGAFDTADFAGGGDAEELRTDTGMFLPERLLGGVDRAELGKELGEGPERMIVVGAEFAVGSVASFEDGGDAQFVEVERGLKDDGRSGVDVDASGGGGGAKVFQSRPRIVVLGGRQAVEKAGGDSLDEEEFFDPIERAILGAIRNGLVHIEVALRAVEPVEVAGGDPIENGIHDGVGVEDLFVKQMKEPV